jgi:DNA topoisomerase-1
VEEILRQKREGPDILGQHPTTGEPILVLTGQYGPYVQLAQVTDENPKPKRSSLPKGMKPEDVTLEIAVGLLALPRLLGTHPEQGGKILAGQGRFGPYILHDKGADGKDYRSIKGEDHVLTITLGRALEMLAQPKLARGRRAAPTPLKELGPHPADKAPVALYDGQYGPYVKHGTISASIPKGTDPQSVTLAQAVDLIAAKAGRAPTVRGRKAVAPRKVVAAAKQAKTPKSAIEKPAPKAAKPPKAAPKSAKAKLLKVTRVVKAKRRGK